MTHPAGAPSVDTSSSRWSWLWAEPDVVLLDASAEGERLSGRIRILVAMLVAMIAMFDFLTRKAPGESLGWAVFAIVGLAGALGLYALIARGFYRPWLGIVTSSLDVSVVSLGLASFLVVGQPELAVNSKVVYDAYFLALAATCLRYEPRICVCRGSWPSSSTWPWWSMPRSTGT